LLGFTTECLREDSWLDLPAKLLRCKRAGLDTESDAPVQISGQINRLKTRPDEDKKYKKEFIDMRRSTTVGFSIAFPDKTSYYIPLQHKRNNVPYFWGLQALKKLLEVSDKENIPIGIHNLSQELMAFERLGIDVPVRTNGSLYCTLVASWMAGYDAKPQWKLGLKDMSKRKLPSTLVRTLLAPSSS
jgi:DNA polymerase I-like protein with 3'-5' exonuclease and polymerase domains